MARRPVTCTNCGYTTTPVSGFCPRCLELLPVAPGFAAVPLLLGATAVLGAESLPSTATDGEVMH